MTTRASSFKIILPVFMSFYIMGFVDIVGVATAYIKEDLNLSATVAQLIPSMVFIWFAFFSIPTGLFQDRKGKRLTVIIGVALTGIGVLVPFALYNLPTIVGGFIILGIGNTVLQVSANPLLLDVSSYDSKAANLSISQFVKAVASMLGPILVTAIARITGDWKHIFPFYALISVAIAIWLLSIRVNESKPKKEPATLRTVIGLLKHPFFTVMIISTFLMVGFDVGMNTNISQFLQEKHSIPVETASLGISIYFSALMIGRLLGGIVLRKTNSYHFLAVSIIVTLIGLIGILVSPSLILSRLMIFITGLGFSNTFPVIFAITIMRKPEYSNELSSLIILSVVGGAFVPPIMGIISDRLGAYYSFYVLVACMSYVAFATYYAMRTRKTGI